MKFLAKSRLVRGLLVLSVAATLSALRWRGDLQWLEWLVLDLSFQLRPAESPDSRFVLVGLTEADVSALKTSQLSDRQLAQLLGQIGRGQPAAIGLDFFRDQPVGEGREELLAAFSAMPHLYGVGKQVGIEGDPDFAPIDPPPIAAGQVADVAVQEDGDSILRRLFLYPKTSRPAVPSLGLALAYAYLKLRGIEPAAGKGGWLKLGAVTFFPFRNPSGPYTQASDGSYQFFPNWRKSKFPFLSVGDVLSGQVSPQQFRQRLVIIGAYAPSKKDQFLTPFSRSPAGTPRLMYGMEVQAQLASAAISNALGERPLVFFWNEPWISLWTLAWAAATLAALARCRRQWLKIWLFLVGSSALLCLATYLAFLEAVWLPTVPALAVIWLSGLAISVFDYELGQRQDRQTIERLNQKLKEKLDKRQIYRDLAVLACQYSESLVPLFHTLLNTQPLLRQQEAVLAEKIAASITDPQLRAQLNSLLAQLAAASQEQGRQLEWLSFKLASYFPNLDSLITFQQPPAPRAVAEGVSPAVAIASALDSLRPLIFDEYQIDLRELVSVQCEVAGEKLPQPQKLAVLFSRLFDEALLNCQLEDAPYPQIDIAATAAGGELEIELAIHRSYQPEEFNLYFCQDLLDYYGGHLSAQREGSRTVWKICLPGSA